MLITAPVRARSTEELAARPDFVITAPARATPPVATVFAHPIRKKSTPVFAIFPSDTPEVSAPTMMQVWRFTL